MYHSSPTLILGSYLEPAPSFLLDGLPVVFAANRRDVSLMFAAKWSDDDIAFGFFDGETPTAREQYPGALAKLFQKRAGYIYKVDPTGFVNDARLGLQTIEFVNTSRVKILEMEFIADIWEELQAAKIVFECNANVKQNTTHAEQKTQVRKR